MIEGIELPCHILPCVHTFSQHHFLLGIHFFYTFPQEWANLALLGCVGGGWSAGVELQAVFFTVSFSLSFFASAVGGQGFEFWRLWSRLWSEFFFLNLLLDDFWIQISRSK